MNQDRWARFKEVVSDALKEDSPEARTALLGRECEDDPSLRTEVESFFEDAEATSGEGNDPFEEWAAAAAAAIYGEEPVMAGRRIGAYVVVRELGRGGMARVYLAARADGYFEKQVAIKVLKPSSGGQTAELLNRFRSEREVLASLEHPNIATLLDAGTTDEGEPYFVMEYVPGTPVTTYVQEHELPIRTRLALFLKICAAVEMAHRKRVVHRDLKRSNILVNTEGEPKLLDFGIAKLLAENPLTLTAVGQQRFTPISASPEQARGEAVTEASDIYALGALLYELLAGRRPHVFTSSNPTLGEIAQVVGETVPKLPSEVAPELETQRILRGDLDAIVLRAMQKDPDRRYASVAELAQDIKSYLAGEPVEARPARAKDRAFRFLSRHKSSVFATAAVLLTLALGLFLFFRPSQFNAERKEAPPEAKIGEKSVAVLPFDDFARDGNNSYFVDGVQDDILTNLAKVEDLKVISRTGVAPYRKNPRDIRKIGRALGVAYVLQGSVRKLDDRVRVNAQLIDTRTDAQIWAEQYDRKIDDLFELQSDLAQAIVTQLKGKLSKREKAAIGTRPTADARAYDLYLEARGSVLQYHFEKAIELLEKAVERDPNFALAYCQLAHLHLIMYRFNGDQSPERLAKANQAVETALRLAPDLPETHLARAQYFYDGLRDYEKTLAELATSPPSPDARARFFHLTAVTERRLGHWKAALRDGLKAIELDPHDPVIATAVLQTYMALRQYRAAEKLAHGARERFTTEMAPFWAYEADCILAQGEIGRARAVLSAAPKHARERTAGLARIAFYERDYARASSEIESGPKPPRATIQAGNDLFVGTVARAQGDAVKSAQSFEKARVVLEKVASEHPDDLISQMNLASVYAGLGRKEDALRLSQKVVEQAPTWRDAAEGPVTLTLRAQIEAWLGEKESAIKKLEELVKHPSSPSYGELKFDPSWDDLRGDPRFAQIVAQAKKPIIAE